MRPADPGLPPLDAAQQAHGERVAALLRRSIGAAGGWLSFADFMQLALYAPGLGYYSAGATRFGPAGDFVTAPELSPLFGRCLARQVADLLAPGDDLVEFGAGTGRLAGELLGALDRAGRAPARYRIVEVSAALREQQAATLAAQAPGWHGRIEWLDGPPAEAWQGVAIANEVVDALPVERFAVGAGGPAQYGVVAGGEGFAWRRRPAPAALAAAIEEIQRDLPEPMPAGYVSELRPWLGQWLAGVTATLARGVMLVVDYGLPRGQYYHPSRDGGTLCGFYRHRRVEDLLSRPGLQDLTAWVDFSALAAGAADAGLDVLGFATQAQALAALGIDRELASAVAGLGAVEHHSWVRGATTLMLPGEMGERFKVMALGRGVPGPLAAFGFRDLRASL